MEGAVARCFSDIGPSDFPEGFIILCADASVVPPSQFEKFWAAITPDRRPLTQSALDKAAVLLVVCDVFDKAQLQATYDALDWMDEFNETPPTVILPVCMGGIGAKRVLEVLNQDHMLEDFLDDVILFEPAGYALALALHASIANVQRKHTFWSDRRLRNLADLKKVICGQGLRDSMLWQYARRNLQLALPPMNTEVDSEDNMCAGYEIGLRLGCGDLGRVFLVHPFNGRPPARQGEVMKVFRKSDMEQSIRGLRHLDSMWRIMRSLSVEWGHPNIAASHQIYHGVGSIFIRMECGGKLNLQQLLQANGGITVEQARDLAGQLADVVDHLHTGPRICHRSIEPTSIVLEEPTNPCELRMKLVSFGDAVVQAAGKLCKRKIGTFPFAAPEVAMQEYEGMAADMWSVGVVLQEVGSPGSNTASTEWMSNESDMDFAEEMPIATQPWCREAVANLVRVVPADRWTSRQLFYALQP